MKKYTHEEMLAFSHAGGGKYDYATRQAVTDFWVKYNYPPTLRDLMAATGCPSLSHMRTILHRLPYVTLVNGPPIPSWVEVAIYHAIVQERAHP